MKNVQNKSIIQVNHLCKDYREFHLKDISFQIDKGTITGIIGENGAGKSTMLKIMMGITKADGGEVRYDGHTLNDYLKSGKAIGYMETNKDIYPDIAMSNLTRFIKNAYPGRWSDEKFQYYYNDFFKIGVDKKMKELSTGMKVKYYLAVELAKQPEILILDEPTSGLDPIMRNGIIEMLDHLAKEESLTLIFSSHLTEDMDKIAQQIIYVDNGQLLLKMDKQKIKQSYKKIQTNLVSTLDITIQRQIKHNSIEHNNYYIYKTDSKTDWDIEGLENVYLDEVLLYLKQKCYNQ